MDVLNLQLVLQPEMMTLAADSMDAAKQVVEAADVFGGGTTIAGYDHSNDTAIEKLLVFFLRIGFVAIIFGIGLCMVRMMRGPEIADRVTAAETVTILIVGLVIMMGIYAETDFFFDAALVVGIIGFVSTIAYSQYIAARVKRDEPLES